MKITIREGMVPGESLTEQLDWLESMEIDGIELHGRSLAQPIEVLREIFTKSRITPSAIEGVPALLVAGADERNAARMAVRDRLMLAGELGAIGVLIVPQFGRTPALPDLSPWKSGADLEHELLIAQLKELVPVARQAGVKMFLEPLNRYEAYIVNRVGQGAAIAQQIGPEVAVMAAFFHMNIEEAEIPASIRASREHIVYVHVADSNRLQPGFGHLDFKPGFAALKEIGYDGYLGIECRIHGDYDEAVRATVSYLKEQWDAA